MDLNTVKEQMRAMKTKVRAARKAKDSTQLRQFQASAKRLWRKARTLMPKTAAKAED